LFKKKNITNIITNFKLMLTGILFAIFGFIILKLIVLPYLKVQKYTKYPGSYTHFIPLVGLFYKFEREAATDKDCFKSYKELALADAPPRFIATNMKTRPLLILIDPKLTKAFYTNQPCYEKELTFFGFMRELLGRTIFVTEGEVNKKRRIALTSIFHYDFIRPFLPEMVGIVNKTYNQIEEKGLNNVEILKEVANISGETIVTLFMGASVLEKRYKGETMPNFLRIMFTNIGVSMKSPWVFFFGAGMCKKMGLFKELSEDIQGVRKLFLDFVKEKKKDYIARGRIPKHEIIETLWKHLEENPCKEYTEEDVDDEYLGFLLGGLANSTHFMQMMFYFMALYPDVVEKLREESKRIYGNGSNLTMDDLHRMDYTQAFIKETIRMGTPVPMIVPRVALKDHILGDVRVKKDTLVTVDLYGRNLDKNAFENPTEFRPERWLGAEGLKDPFSYIPFSAGYMGCIG